MNNKEEEQQPNMNNKYPLPLPSTPVDKLDDYIERGRYFRFLRLSIDNFLRPLAK